MFSFVRRELDGYLSAHWNTPFLRNACDQIARDAGHLDIIQWCGKTSDEIERRQVVRDEVIRLMDADAKMTGLKQIQGLIWRSGFASGELQAHVYEDVPPALEAWNRAAIDVRIYSSGSIGAQKLFFAHAICGTLLPLIGGHYDTATGPKTEPEIYARIACEFRLAQRKSYF